jgi:predicted O-methyltransferase YrrM
MKFKQVMDQLKRYEPPPGWAGQIFLLPEPVMAEIYDHILRNNVRYAIELGSGFGATTCAMAAALEETGGRAVTIDLLFHQPVNVQVLMRHAGLDDRLVEIIADQLGYNWVLADTIQRQTSLDTCQPLYDFCLLDGAHEWAPDALAFNLVAKLLKPGAWIAVDDINFKLRMIPNWQESHGDRSDRELDAFQMKMVFDLVVRQHPDFTNFKITHEGRVGWAQKRGKTAPHPLVAWLYRKLS